MPSDLEPTRLRLGTRASALAQAQSRLIASELEKQHAGLKVELILCTTTGDRIQDRPLHDVGGKGLFTKELEDALLAGTIDFAVHSLKDVPVTMPLVDPSRLTLAAVPTREDVRDVLVSTVAKSISTLPKNAAIGTGSLRRRCQLLALRPDLAVKPIRGNIDTRIRKLREGQFDAIILALAGLKRSGFFDETFMHPIPIDELIPSAGQGALALQCRVDDRQTIKLLSALNYADTHTCVNIERALVTALQGDCHSPIAALATTYGGTFEFRASVGARGGELPVVSADSRTSFEARDDALQSVLQSLNRQGASELLR